MKLLRFLKRISQKQISKVVFICLVFTLLYLVLEIIRFENFGAFGFDLGLTDQIFWKYSHFQAPITTIHYFPFTSLLSDHFELIFAPLSIFYWIWESPKMLLFIQTFFVCFSGIPIFLMAKKANL